MGNYRFSIPDPDIRVAAAHLMEGIREGQSAEERVFILR